MKPLNLSLLAAGALFCLTTTATQAKNQPQVPVAQSRAFALGYTLRASDLRSIAFTESVKRLKTIDNDQIAGADVARLSKETLDLRREQETAYEQTSRLLVKMNAPPILSAWANRTAASLKAPLMYSEEDRSLSKTEPDTATVLAALDEINSVKAVANSQQPTLAAWLKLNGGALAVWSAEVGSYTADLQSATTAGSRDQLQIGTARRLLLKAPPDTPAATREELAALIPTRGGNLQNLTTLLPPNVSLEKMTLILERLLAIYSPDKAI